MNRNKFQFWTLMPGMTAVIAHYGVNALANWDLSNA